MSIRAKKILAARKAAKAGGSPSNSNSTKAAPIAENDTYPDAILRQQKNVEPIGSGPEYGGNSYIPANAGNAKPTVVKDRAATSIIKFPLTREDLYPASIVFHPYKIDTGAIDQSLESIFNEPLISDYVNKKDSESTNDEAVASEQSLAVTVEQRQKTELEAWKAKQERDSIAKEIKEAQAAMGDKLTDLRAYRDLSRPAVQLFLPQQLQYNDAVNYNSANLGAGGMTALAGLNSGQSIGAALKSGVTEGMESIFNLAKGTLSQDAAKVAASRIASKLPAGFAAAGSTALQTGLNPGTRLIFDQPAMRMFSFAFKLIPVNPQEAKRIQSIVENFRFQMYPREIDVSPGIPIGYEFPNIYRIQFTYDNGTIKLPKIQYAYLKDVQASYNSTSGGVFFEDGHPTEVDLNLTFLEYRALSKRDIEAGF